MLVQLLMEMLWGLVLIKIIILKLRQGRLLVKQLVLLLWCATKVLKYIDLLDRDLSNRAFHFEIETRCITLPLNKGGPYWASKGSLLSNLFSPFESRLPLFIAAPHLRIGAKAVNNSIRKQGKAGLSDCGQDQLS